ncbi:phage protease [Rhodobacteraceae bacterium M382]|nr:phage protease [Rhodobacteraceae bacterium M382]
MTGIDTTLALCAQDLSVTADTQAVPEWIHLLPSKGGQVHTGDSRGPYIVGDAKTLIAASLHSGGRLPIDECHSTDLAAPKGLPAPARGWITELQARDDGVWGKVEWTDAGRDLVATRAYRGISPVINHPKKGSKTIIAIARASLVNTPNLQGLTTLHQENTDMTFRTDVAGWLGLGSDASDDDIQAKITGLQGDGDVTALQSQIGEIGIALGVRDGGDVLAAAKAASSNTGTDGEVVTALQAEVTELTTQNASLNGKLDGIMTERAQDKAVAFVDGEIERGRVIPKSMRDHYVTRHQKEPDAVEKEIRAMPCLGGSVLSSDPPETTTSLNSQELAAKANTYQKQRADEGITVSITEAVHAVQEGKA